MKDMPNLKEVYSKSVKDPFQKLKAKVKKQAKENSKPEIKKIDSMEKKSC